MKTIRRRPLLLALALGSLFLSPAGKAASTTISYRYDGAGRLIGANYGGTSSSAFSYDKNGNLLSLVDSMNPFLPLAGKYLGAVDDAAGPDLSSAGMLTLMVTSSGSFTGKIILGGVPYPVMGQFDPSGAADVLIDRKAPLADAMLHLQLDLAGATGEITGTLTGGVTGSTIADRAGFDQKLNPLPSGLVGSYTALFEHTDSAAAIPQGNGYGVVSVSADGSVKLVGALADGTKFTQGSTIADTFWPLFASLKTRGYLAGPVTFAVTPGMSDFAGQLDWFKPATAGTLYPGVIDTKLGFIGSRYTPPAKGRRALDLADAGNNAEVTASGGNITTALDQVVTLNTSNKFVITDASRKLKLTLTTKSGLVNGSFVDGANNIKLQGVAFQERDIASGFALGPSLTGPFSLAAP